MKNHMLVVLVLLAAGCGGGGGSDSGGDGGGGDSSQGLRNGIVTVNEPVSNNRSYTTRAPSLEIRGTAYTAPDDLDCATSQPIQLAMEWRNAGTGQSGAGGIQTRCQNSFLGNLPVTRWGIPYGSIDLAIGANNITITVSGGGRRGSATITVNRVEDTTPPSIISRSPAPGATDFAVNSKVAVTFSEEMLRSSLTEERFRIEDAAGLAVGGFLGYTADNKQWTMQPVSPLAYSTTYTVTIDGDVEDRFGGNTMGADVSWSFTTGPNPDMTPPQVTGTSPTPNLSCVGPDAQLSARFSEALDPGTVNSQTFTLSTAGGAPIDATVSHSGQSAELRPTLPLAPDTAYVATLSAIIADLAGNTLGTDYTWSFRTTNTADAGSWTATKSNGAPPARYKHTAVWTGSEMIVWGGRAFISGNFAETNTGGRYDPATDSWRPVSTAGIPPKQDHTAVWTGSEMIVWGDYTDVGGRYDPGTDTWQLTSQDGAPSSRIGNVAAWTGTEMIVWGGMTAGGTLLGSGARYNPSTDTWTPMSGQSAPAPRANALHVWTGDELIVWGGGEKYVDMTFVDGARYDPATDTWTPIAATDIQQFSEVVAVWTGTGMILWDGGSPTFDSNGGFPRTTSTLRLYDPVSDTWRESDSPCEPYLGGSILQAHWTGDRMFVWADNRKGGFFYEPATDNWVPITTAGAPAVRSETASVWIGDRFVLWGGQTTFDGLQDSGFVYTP